MVMSLLTVMSKLLVNKKPPLIIRVPATASAFKKGLYAWEVIITVSSLPIVASLSVVVQFVFVNQSLELPLQVQEVAAEKRELQQNINATAQIVLILRFMALRFECV